MLPPPAAWLLDLDGTLYADGAAIPGAIDAVARLRRKRIPFRCVSNTSGRSRRLVAERLRHYGFDIEPDEIVTSVLAGAALLRQDGHRRVAPFVAAAALEDLAGFALSGGTGPAFDGGVPPDAVLIGDLGERWSYALMQEAFQYLRGGAALVALSRDRYWRHDGRLVLDAGPFVAGLEYASGVPATLAGKPSAAFFRTALAALGPVEPAAVAMIGDDVWSDVDGARRAGLQGWLVRTGKFEATVLDRSGIVPDRVVDSVAAVAG